MENTGRINAQDRKYILDIPQLLWKWKIPILAGAFLCALLFFVIARFCITPLYSTSATLYVSNGKVSEESSYITSSDLSASSQLVDTYAAIIMSDVILGAVIEDCSLDISIDELADILEVSSVNNTEVFTVSVQYEDPDKAAEIVNSITNIAPEQIISIINGSSVTVINYARVPTGISYPNYKKMAILGFALGMVLIGGCLLIREMLDTRIKKASDFSRWSYPLLASVPDFTDKKQASYGYSKQKEWDGCFLTEHTPFAVQEAYKTLRTNVIFSSPDQEKRIVVITSAQKGEAKSTTAINLATAFAQNQSKVLLMECDLRLPCIAKRMGLKRGPGLTDLILGLETDAKVLYAMKNGLHILTSGTIPPNPTEILGSKKMERILSQLTQHYDYIIMDTPPLETMPDAAILSKYATDVILVTKQNATEREVLDAVIEKLELAQARLLGFVFTCVSEDNALIYRKYRYEYGYSGRKPRETSGFLNAYRRAKRRSAGEPHERH